MSAPFLRGGRQLLLYCMLYKSDRGREICGSDRLWLLCSYGPLNYNPVEEWFFHRIKEGRPIPVPGSGLQVCFNPFPKLICKALLVTEITAFATTLAVHPRFQLILVHCTKPQLLSPRLRQDTQIVCCSC